MQVWQHLAACFNLAWLSFPCRAPTTAGAEIGVASTKAYTSQIVAITMMALVLSEDAISKRQRRDEVIDSLCNLPGGCRRSALAAWHSTALE